MSYIASDIQEFLQANGAALAPETFDALKTFFAQRCVVTWGVGDVHVAAQTCRRVLSDAEAVAVLARVQLRHDCTVGVTWETLECACLDYGRPMTAEEVAAADCETD